METTSSQSSSTQYSTCASTPNESTTILRSRFTERLKANPILDCQSVGSTPTLNDEHLHAVVGQHLVLTPSPQEMDLASLSSGGTSSVDSLHCQKQILPSLTTTSTTSKASDESSEVVGSNAHFQLQGGADTNEVYKWHLKQTRQKLGSRSYSYHVPHQNSTTMSLIKTPGGLRRYFINQDALSRGEPAPRLHSSSFIHFLGLFSMYEVAVPETLEKPQLSLADTFYGELDCVAEDDLQGDEETIDAPEEKMSFSKAVGMLFKTFIASGILFLPNAFKNGGIIFAPIFMTLIAALCLHSFLLLVKCRELRPGSYGDIGQYFYGRWMRYIVLFAITISQFGFCCGYCIFFAQQFAIVVDSLGGAHLDKIVWIVIFFVILVPFTLVRNIGKLGFSTLIADICIIVGLIYLYVYDIKELAVNRDSPMPLRLFNSDDFGIFIGTAVFSYEGIGMVIPICSSMANPKQFPRALTIVLSVVCVMLVSFGSLGYAAYGEKVQTIILDNLPHQTGGEKAGKSAIQLLYIIAVFLTTPLMLFPCIRIVEQAIFSVVQGEPLGKSRLMKENVVRIAINFAVAVVAYAGYSKLDIFISFVGSFACAPLLFIFPPMFHIRAFPDQPLWRKASDVALILFGFLVFFFTLVTTIQGFSKQTVKN